METQVDIKMEDHCDNGHNSLTFNPWNVPNASVFLKYHCPECTFQCTKLSGFSNHALANHDRSQILFSKSDLEDEEIKDLELKSDLQEPIKTEPDIEYFDDKIEESFDEEPKVSVFKCYDCQEDYESLELLQKHCESEHGKKFDFQCKTCGIVLKTQKGYEKHLKSHEESVPSRSNEIRGFVTYITLCSKY